MIFILFVAIQDSYKKEHTTQPSTLALILNLIQNLKSIPYLLYTH